MDDGNLGSRSPSPIIEYIPSMQTTRGVDWKMGIEITGKNQGETGDEFVWGEGGEKIITTKHH